MLATSKPKQAQERETGSSTSFPQPALTLLGRVRGWWPVLVILALPVCLLAPALFGGGATTATDLLTHWQPWSAELSRVPVQSPALFDDVQQGMPWLLFTRHELLAGRLPLWNPLVAGGTPFIGAGQTAVFYPLTWLGVLLPFPFSATVMTLLKWWMVGLGMYLFARSSLRLKRPAALAAALSFMFCSFIVVWLIHPVGRTAMLLPWVMWATEWTIRQPSKRRVAVLAVISGLIGLAGHPEMALHVLLGATLYALWLVGVQRPLPWRERARLLTIWAGGVTLGITLAAIQYLPTIALIPQSLSFSARAADYTGLNVPLSGLPTWLVPNFWGRPLIPDDYHGPVNYNEEVWYVGVVALLLAGVAVAALRRQERRRQIAFFALLLLVFACLLYRIPPFYWLTFLPILRVDSWTRLGLLALFCASTLAGFGFEELLNWGQAALTDGPGPGIVARHRRAPDRRVLIGLLVSVPALALAFWWIGRLAPGQLTPMQTQRLIPWLRVALVVVWAAGALLVVGWRGWLNQRLVGGLMLGVMLCDLLLFAAPYTPQPSARLAFPRTPTIAHLQQTVGTARMTASDNLLPPDTNIAYGLNDLRAYEVTASSRYQRFMFVADPWLYIGNPACCETPFCPSANLLGVASVEYFATLARDNANTCGSLDSGEPIVSSPFQYLWTQGDISLWRNTLARPFFYFANQVVGSSGETQTLAALPGLTPGGRDAIIEGASSVPGDHTRSDGSITVLSRVPGTMTLQVTTPRGHWLVINESYESGWQARLDGTAQAVHPANELFQAVYIPAGSHNLHLFYRPAAFVVGALLSALALGALLVLLLADWVQVRLRRRQGRLRLL